MCHLAPGLAIRFDNMEGRRGSGVFLQPENVYRKGWGVFSELLSLDEVKRNPGAQTPDSARLHPGYALSFQSIEETFVRVP